MQFVFYETMTKSTLQKTREAPCFLPNSDLHKPVTLQ